jgi:hypothetical protein
MKFEHYIRVPICISVKAVKFNDDGMSATLTGNIFRIRIALAFLKASLLILVDGVKVLLFGSAEARP